MVLVEEEEEETINTTWIDDFVLYDKREREPMEVIRVCLVYMSSTLEIQHRIIDMISLQGGGGGGGGGGISFFCKERLLQYILEKKNGLVGVGGGIGKYELYDILYYNVPLEVEQFYSFLQEDMTVENATQFLHTATLSKDLILVPSVSIFHRIHTVYFFFREEEKRDKENHRHTLRSILKKDITSRFGKERILRFKEEGGGEGKGMGKGKEGRKGKGHSFTRRNMNICKRDV